MAVSSLRTKHWTRVEYERLIDLGAFRPASAWSWSAEPCSSASLKVVPTSRLSGSSGMRCASS